jgi:uncharacterized protein YprB with RNaseH-like and TPR domain
VSLRSRLERLGAGPPSEPSATLRTLRKSIERSLGKAKKQAAQPPVGFSRTDSPHGPLFVRQVRFARQERFGSQEFGHAESASSQMLALLALDPTITAATSVNFLYLDTETTGLSHGAGTVPFLIGLAFWEDGQLVVEQLLLMNFGEEKPILLRVLERLARASALVTFNGKSFDVPLLRARAVLQKVEFKVAVPHIDLVHMARRIHRVRNIDCTLSNLERELLNVEREGDIGGAAIPALYTQFLKTRKPDCLAGVIAHNELDMLAMLALVGLYGAPMSQLQGLDLAGVARTLRRAGSHDQAHAAAERAASTFGTAIGIKERALAQKARGNRAAALQDLEEFIAQVDDPHARLELAKLYEHFVRDPEAALEMARLGTSEAPTRATERRRRLERKARRLASEGQPSLPGIVVDRGPCRTAKLR